jgi:hypothetical protein
MKKGEIYCICKLFEKFINNRIAENKNIELFKSLISETKHIYLKEIKIALNESKDPS